MSDNSNPLAGTGTAEGLSEDDAFAAFAAEDALEDEGATEDEDEEAQADGDAEPEDGDEPDEEGEDEDDGDKPDDGDKAKKPEAIIKLDDGTEVPMSEVVQGYMRTADYTRKTQALAAQRAEFEATQAKTREQVDQRRAQLDEAFEGVVSLLSARLPREPDPSLAMTDPSAYVQQRAFYDASMKELQAVLGQQAQVKEQQSAAEKQAMDARLAVEAQKVAAIFPEANDPAKAKDFWRSAFSAGQKLGLSVEELNGITDHRLIVGLAKLARFEAQEAAKTTAQAGKQPVASQQAKRPAPVAPRPAMRSTPANEALRSFQKTRSVRDAERAFEAMDFR